MRKVVGCLALAGLLATAACGGGGGPERPFAGPGGDMHRPPGQESYSQALAMRESQGCSAAVTPLRRFASYGGGFEIAQFQLGDCLVEEARATPDAVKRDDLAQEALTNLLKAANSNEPNAQGLLADLYFKGDIIPQDKVAAGMWLLLYQRNNLRINLGARSLSSGLQADMLKGLSDDEWAQARVKADEFQPVIQPNNAPANTEQGPNQPPSIDQEGSRQPPDRRPRGDGDDDGD